MLEATDVILAKAASLSAAEAPRGWVLEAKDVVLVKVRELPLAPAAKRSQAPAAKVVRRLVLSVAGVRWAASPMS